MKLTIIASLYRSDRHIMSWAKRVKQCMEKLEKEVYEFEVLAIANDPTEKEREAFAFLSKCSWFKLIEVPRETIYASWNRGIREASGDVCTFWNADDIRFFKGFIDGLKLISGKNSASETSDGSLSADIVYFPFIYKRYVRIFNIPFLAKIKVFNPPQFDKEKFGKEMHCGPFFMASKKAFEKTGMFDESFKIAGDYDWCARASLAGAVFKKSETIAGIFTNDGTTLSGSKADRHKEENARVLARSSK